MMPFVDQIEAGTYTVRLIKHGLRVPVRFWFGQPVLDDGEVLDRSPRWCVMVDGATTCPALDPDGLPIDGVRELLDPYATWPYACGHRISEREFQFLTRRREWAREHDYAHPAANARRPFNVLDLKPGW